MTRQLYRTSNFYLAVFLHAEGIELADIDRTTDRRRAAFIFAESPAREHLAHAFNFAPEGDSAVGVDARKLIHSIKILKEKLYQD